MGLDIGIYKCIVLFSVCLLVRNKLSKKCNRTVCIFWYISHFRDKSILIREKKHFTYHRLFHMFFWSVFRRALRVDGRRNPRGQVKKNVLLSYWCDTLITSSRDRGFMDDWSTFCHVLDHVIRYLLFGAYNSFVQISAYLLVTESVRCAY